MHDILVLANSVFAILLIVFLVIYLRVNPLIALIAGPLYLGLSSGVSFDDTIKAITSGFGDLMARIGLLIGFGVMIGAFMYQMGVFERVVAGLLRTFGKKPTPFAFTAILTSVFPPIYTDVLVVISAPLARMLAQNLGPRGLPMMAAAVGVGVELALVMVVPGVAALALAAVLKVELGTMLLYGLMIAVPTSLLTLLAYSMLLKAGLWNAEKDELPVEEVSTIEDRKAPDNADETAETEAPPERRGPPLVISLLPVIIPLVMISAGAMNRALKLNIAALNALGNATFALFIGLVVAFLIGRYALTPKQRTAATTSAFKDSGQILLLTGVAGSLSAVVGLTELGKILAGYFAADSAAPLLLVWTVACVLHIAIGSVSVSAITAAGLLAPIAGNLHFAPVWIALSAASGSMFLIHVTSNTFWMFGALMGLSLRGTLKTFSLAVSMASVVSLILILLLSHVV